MRTRWTVACVFACLATAGYAAAPLNGLLACRDIADAQARLAAGKGREVIDQRA